MYRPRCKYLRRGERCNAGCTRDVSVCHKFYKYGECMWGDRCRKCHFPGREPPPFRGTRQRPPPPPPPPDPKPEPYVGARNDLELLALNRDGVNVSRRMIDNARKQRMLETHPDKHRDEDRDACWHQRFLDVVAAAERLLKCGAFPDRCG